MHTYTQTETDIHIETRTHTYGQRQLSTQAWINTSKIFTSWVTLHWNGEGEREIQIHEHVYLMQHSIHSSISDKSAKTSYHIMSLYFASPALSLPLPIISVSYNLAQSHIYKYLVYKETDRHKCLKTGELVSKRVRLGEWGDTSDKKLYECGFRSLYISNYS